MEETIIKVHWKKHQNKKWHAELKVDRNGEFSTRKLSTGKNLNFEITNKRKCTGFAVKKGERKPCPENKEINKGTQCNTCANKDIYTNYIRGDKSTNLEGNFSLYLAQIGNTVKVGVTRTERIMQRWVEQGADYAVQLDTGLKAKEALEKEDQISSKENITQRINKKDKVVSVKSSKHIQNTLKTLEKRENNIENIQEKTSYSNNLPNNLRRKGLFKGDIKAVKGKIISNGQLNMVLTSGKTIKPAEQNSLNEF